jgi:aminopeptidase N
MRQFYILFSFFIYTTITQAQQGCAYHLAGGASAALAPSVSDIANMNKYDVHYYKLDIEVQNNSVYISGNVTVQAKVVQPLTDITLQLHPNFTIDSIVLNNTSATYNRAADILTIAANQTLQANTFFKLIIYYRGSAPTTGQAAIGKGFTTNTTKKVTWSLSEPYSAFEWWPCKQVLTDKADSCEIWVTTDTVNKAGSNGLLQNTVTLGNGKVRYEWKSNYPIAYYLISVTVCPYVEYITYAHPVGADSILIQNYLYKDATADEIQSIQQTASLIELYSSKFGLYPFSLEKYGHTQASFGGAMEHQTMSTMGAIDFGIVSHELAHQWFGDFVTAASWNDIWLHEGFASYVELVALENLKTPEEAESWIDQAMSYAKGAIGNVYVFDSLNVSRLFDLSSTYEKGAILLRMLRFEFNNDSLFFAGLKTYLQAHSYSTARASDFKTTMEQTLGKSLAVFFDQWYYNPGYPILSGQWNQWNDKVWLQLNQQASEGSTVFNTPITVTLKYDGGDTTMRIQMDQASKLYYFHLPAKTVYTLRIDEQNYILNDVFSIAKNLQLDIQENTNPEFDEVVLFPNPVAHALTISGALGSQAKVFDAAGRLIAQYEVRQDQAAYNMDNIAPGIYIIHLTRNGATTNRKFFKN